MSLEFQEQLLPYRSSRWYLIHVMLLMFVVKVSHAESIGSYQFQPLDQKPISLQSGILKAVQTRWNNAQQLALLEQAVEDYNAEEIVAVAPDATAAVSYRRLIVLPLDERFDPPAGVFSHGHVQTGDKMSLPKEFWTAIQLSNAEVPWLFEVSRVEGITGPRAKFAVSTSISANPISGCPETEDPGIDRVVGGAIDFRSPANYCFLPRWMMVALALRPRDVVDVKLIQTVPAGSSVKLRPHTSDFIQITNHQAVLETELKHYSALTSGATIPFDYNGKRYYFDVVDLRSAPRGEKVPMCVLQDCNIIAEFVRPKDQLKKKKNHQKKGE